MANTDIQHLERLRTYWTPPRLAVDGQAVRGGGHVVYGLQSSDLVSRLNVAGYVERGEGRTAPTKRFLARALVGQVRAGLPQPVPDDDFEAVTIDDYLVPEAANAIASSADRFVMVAILTGARHRS